LSKLSTSADNLAGVITNVLNLRNRRNKSGNKKEFDRLELAAASKLHDYVPQTFNDYADTNFRYLKATGLVQNKGRGITLVPEKHVFIEKLVEDKEIPESDADYYVTLCNGARLPTDDKDSALIVLDDLLNQLSQHGAAFDMSGRSLDTPADIASVRHEIEAILFARNEEEYAARQAGEWEEITAYMDMLIHRSHSKVLSSGDEIEIPKAEAPAYLEWILWRAFLAINSLVNKPYQARRFNIDQDFLPVGTAPGNGPDLIFEFNDFVLVVEVTLTTNSRQEAAEGVSFPRNFVFQG
jgi:hypothetical protein